MISLTSIPDFLSGDKACIPAELNYFRIKNKLKDKYEIGIIAHDMDRYTLYLYNKEYLSNRHHKSHLTVNINTGEVPYVLIYGPGDRVPNNPTPFVDIARFENIKEGIEYILNL